MIDGIKIAYREYHVDTHVCLESYVSVQNINFGGDISVRRDCSQPPLMIIGQDESTFHQYIFSKRGGKPRLGAIKSYQRVLVIW